MSPEQARQVIEGELGDRRLEDAFAWVDLEQPLGSATIAQASSSMPYAQCAEPNCLHA